ncbi:hypothetical protein DB346_16915 [Verrucomicrobia bacterium LW23]|nr:hypothetical protein DB346_16915 [Verrucomicrobia bacterium LW23]
MPPLPVIDCIRRRDSVSRPSQHAFTLIELLVGVTVLAVMVVLLSQLVIYSENVWHMTEAKKEQLQTARALSDFMGRELQSALLPINRPSQTDLQFVVNPTAVTSTYRNRDAFFWQTPLASDPSLGDVAEVGYFVRWDTSVPSNPRALLCRFYLNPTSPDYKIHTEPAAWISDALLNTAAPAVQTGGDNSYLGLFAENVIGLWVECLDSSGKVIAKNDAGQPFAGASFDSRQGYTDSNGVVKTRGALPVAVDLSLVLMDSRTARRLGPQEQAAILALAGDPGVTNGNTFVTRAISMPAFSKIRAGIRAYQTRIYLQGSK